MRKGLKMNATKMEELKIKFEEEVESMKRLDKDRMKCINNRRQLESQLTENQMVKSELDLLKPEAKVFKLIGPVLVKQDLGEAKQNVKKRIDYISTEINRVESLLEDFMKKIEGQKQVLEKIRDKIKPGMKIA